MKRPWATQPPGHNATSVDPNRPIQGGHAPHAVRRSGLILTTSWVSALSTRIYMVRARQILDILDDEADTGVETSDSVQDNHETASNAWQVKTDQSPYIHMFFKHHPVRIVVNSGATCNMNRYTSAKRLGAKILKTFQSARQADGSSPLNVVGETRFTPEWGDTWYYFKGLVIKNLDTEIQGGVPFLQRNDLPIRPARSEIWIGDTRIRYGSFTPTPTTSQVRSAHALRAPQHLTTIWPGEYMELSIPNSEDDEFAIEPGWDSGSQVSKRTWP